MKLPPLSLYVHLPWCERKCPYCDFNSHEADILPESQYVAALIADLEADLALAQDRPLHSIFIGGGTPSLFSASAMGQLLCAIDRVLPFPPDMEITLEANPGSAEAAKFRAFRAAGVNRLSLGIQSFNDASLHSLGRVHNGQQAKRAIDYADQAGFDNFNLDLIHGLPGQTPAQAQQDLETAMGYAPTHLSWYQLTIEPNTVFYKRPPLLPVETVLADIQDHGEQSLADSGYRQYEVSAFARDGFQCRHNRNYWEFGDYLAIGAGAHGKVSYADGRILRYSKRRQPADYLTAQAGSHTADTRELHAQELAGEFAMNALRLKDGFTPGLFTDRTGLDGRQFAQQVAALSTRGLIDLDDSVVKASAVGYRFLDSLIAEFFPD